MRRKRGEISDITSCLVDVGTFCLGILGGKGRVGGGRRATADAMRPSSRS